MSCWGVVGFGSFGRGREVVFNVMFVGYIVGRQLEVVVRR